MTKTKSRRFIAMLVAVMMVFATMPLTEITASAATSTGNTTEFAGGSGTDEDPYLISSEKHLNNVRKYPDAFFKMINDINMSNQNFSPIEEFNGDFNGGGYQIINLTIDITEEVPDLSSWEVFVGLFAVNNGCIYDLGLSKGEINFDSTADIPNSTYECYHANIGGIAGKNTGDISRCFNENVIISDISLRAKTAHCGASIGGIVGENSGSIINCYNVANIESVAASYDADDYYGGASSVSNYVGGISGENRDSVVECYNLGNIIAARYGAIYGNGGSTTPREGIGGIVGRNHSYIIDCISSSEGLPISGIKAVTEEINNSSCDIEAMKNKETYVLFDFDSIWEMDDYYEYSYPQLISCRKERIEKIEIVSLPHDLRLIEKKKQLIPDFFLKIYYEDDFQKEISASTDLIVGFNDKKIGVQDLIVRYGGKEAGFTAEIIEKQLENIAILNPPLKTKYLEAKDPLDLTGAKLKLNYNNDTSEEIDISEDLISGFDNTKPGAQEIIITYKGLSTSFFIEIIPKRIVGIEISRLPQKLIYLEETSVLDATGGEVKVFYDNDTFQYIDMSLLEINGFDNKNLGTQTLTINYEGFSDEYEITVAAKTLLKIEISNLPSKTNYLEAKENLDLTGGKIKLIYDNNTFNEIDLEKASVSGFNNTIPGEQNINVVYQSKETQFKVFIMEREENLSDFAGGIGESYKPYLVSTKEHLNNVRKYPNAYFKQVNDIVFSPADFAVGGAYYNSGYSWMPIGKDSSSAFAGSYDGGGYAIKNLKVSIETANSAYGGLFGYCTGDLKNITIENSDIKVTASGTAYAGGIVGYHTEGTIENCHNNNTTVNAQYGGGIIGYSYYSDLIKDCSNSGKIEGTYIGGIVGAIYATTYYGGTVGAYTDEDADVIGCVNNGEFIKSESSGAYIGGIVGYVKSGTLIVRNCINNGNIYATGFEYSSITIGGAPVVGGVVGYSYSTDIGNCSNSADIYGDYSGGILGYGNTKIVNSTNTGNISGGKYVGGIVGWHNDGSIYSSVNKGKIVGIRYLNSNIYSNKSDAAGGIVGAARNGSGIYECSNLGDVSNGTYSGGIVGIGDYVSQCYNNGKVTSIDYSGGICADFLDSYSKIWDCYNIGNISGKYAAGLLANMEYGMVLTSYSVGKISATESGGYIAAIVAYQTGGTVTDCYYLDNINIGVGYVDYSISNTPETIKLNKENMQNLSNFNGFDFDSIWTMDGNAEYPYPELKSVEMIYVPYVLGDIDGVEGITDADAEYLLMYTFFPEDYPVNQECDFNGDGKVNDADAEHLLMFTFFPEDYPLH